MRRMWRMQAMSVLTLGLAAMLLSPAVLAESTSSDQASTNGALLISPRFEAYVGSSHALTAAIQRSHTSTILSPLLTEWAADNRDDNTFIDQSTALLGRLTEWPETSLSLAMYAPDNESNLRWRVYVDWSLDECVDQLKSLLNDEAYEDYFAGVKLSKNSAGYVVKLKDDVLAYLQQREGQTAILSHVDIPTIGEIFHGQDTLDERRVLLACRRILTQTETDSGETFFSQFRFLTEFDYSAAQAESGEWIEQLSTSWPPISGTVAKAMLGRVRQTFFVPQESLLSSAFEVTLLPAMLDSMVGLGPQTTFSPSGEITIIGEYEPGVLAGHASSEMCFTLLAGTGFFPAPDVVLQTRLTDVDQWRADMQASTTRLNHEFAKRDQEEPWHTDEVDGVTVYWRDSTPTMPGATMPFLYRSVLFSTNELDSRDRDRDFLVMGFTSTDPLKLVRRWRELPRTADEKIFLPTERRTNGQVWLNWKAIYGTLAPYFNLALSGASTNRLLPAADKVADQLTPGLATMKVSYTSASLNHTGPAPIGALAVPSMFFSAQSTSSSNSDLARERLAIERLKLLYHHAKLFKQDIGRWPARVSELDGYVDFAGHPELLKLPRSSAKSWSQGFENLFLDMFVEGHDEDIYIDGPTDEGLGATGRIDDSLYAIDWGRDAWTLGYTKDSLEHLETLCIDQDGKIHRTAKRPEPAAVAKAEDEPLEPARAPDSESTNASSTPESDATPPAETTVTAETE